jgi:hypothetical protein
MNGDTLEKISNLLVDIFKMVSILTIAQKLTEALSEEERVYLSQALASAMSSDGTPRFSPPGQSGYPNPPTF